MIGQPVDGLEIKNHVEPSGSLRLLQLQIIYTRFMIFVGHGRSQAWRELKDFLVERLFLRWEEFNRESVAGRSTKERLEEMLKNVDFAFIVMTAEDEHPSGTMHPRANVIHEAGLFQGRLGFEKAIILLEDGCAEFSNIHGLTQIRFPKDNISVCFEEVRRVLEREGIISGGDNRPSDGGVRSGPVNYALTSTGSAVATKAATMEERKPFLPATQEAFTLNIQSGSDQGFLILIKNESDQDFLIMGAAAEWNGSSLGRIHRPPSDQKWIVAAKGQLVIRWADDIHLVSIFCDLKSQYQGSFTDFVDFIFHCSVAGENKIFRKKIKVQVDAVNRRMTQV